MGPKVKRFIALGVVLFCGCKRLGEASLADRVVSAGAAAYPAAKVTKLDDNHVQFVFDAGSVVMGLDDLETYCGTFPQQCDAELRQRVRHAEQQLK
jgi:hypothetical protein